MKISTLSLALLLTISFGCTSSEDDDASTPTSDATTADGGSTDAGHDAGVGMDARTFPDAEVFDAGPTRWTSTPLDQPISPDGDSATSPYVAMGENGEAVIVWMEGDGTTDCGGVSCTRIYRSTYRNGQWADPTGLTDSVSPGTQSAESPRVAVDASGDAIIVWRQTDGSHWQIFRSELRNGVWTDPASVTDNFSPNGDDVYGYRVAMSNNGDAMILWAQGDGVSVSVFKSEYRNGQWTDPANLDDHFMASAVQSPASTPNVAMDDNGNAIVAWRQAERVTQGCENSGCDRIYRAMFYQAGTSSVPDDLLQFISPAGTDVPVSSPVVATSSSGEDAIITWAQSDGAGTCFNLTNCRRIFKSEFHDGMWTDPTNLQDNISPDTESAHGPKIAMNDSGDAVIVWHQEVGASLQVFRSQYTDGMWTHPQDLEDYVGVQGQSIGPWVAMDDNGAAIMVWTLSDGFKQRIAKSEYRNGMWHDPMSAADNLTPQGDHSDGARVDMANDDTAVIVWEQFNLGLSRIYRSTYR